MKNISEDFREKDGGSKPSESASKEFLVAKSKRFEGFKVDELFHTIYENTRNEKEADIISDCVTHASMMLMGVDVDKDKKELERFNLMNQSLAEYGLRIDTANWTLDNLIADIKLKPLILETNFDYDMSKAYRRLRKEVNFVDHDIVDKALEDSEKVVGSSELQPMFFRKTLKDEPDSDLVTYVSKQVFEFICQLKAYYLGNNRRSKYISIIVTAVLDDIRELAVGQNEQYMNEYNKYNLDTTFTKLQNLAISRLQFAYDSLFLMAEDKVAGKSVFKDGKVSLDESKFPSKVMALKGNNFSVYSDFTDEKFFCKMLGVSGVA